MNSFRNQPKQVLFDDITLTGTYQTAVIPVGGYEKLSLDIDYEQDGAESGNTFEMKIEHSTDQTNWHSLVIDDTDTVSTITPRVWNIAGDSTAPMNVVLDIAYHFLRVSVRETGIASNGGTVTMTAVTSGL